MERTINGKKWEEISKELGKPLTEEAKGTTGKYSYTKIKYLRNRLNEVVGILNYDTYYSKPEIQKIEIQDNEKNVTFIYVIVVHCKLVIRDDIGNEVITKEGIGSVNLTYANEERCGKENIPSWKPLNIANDVKICAGKSFKDCIKQLIPSEDDDEEDDCYTKVIKVGKDIKELPMDSETQNKTQEYSVYILDSMKERGAAGYSWKCRVGEEEMILIIWKDQLNNAMRNRNMTPEYFIGQIQPSVEMTIKGKIEMYKLEKRLTFSDWVEGR